VLAAATGAQTITSAPSNASKNPKGQCLLAISDRSPEAILNGSVLQSLERLAAQADIATLFLNAGPTALLISVNLQGGYSFSARTARLGIFVSIGRKQLWLIAPTMRKL
jgi:hypothetical protein